MLDPLTPCWQLKLRHSHGKGSHADKDVDEGKKDCLKEEKSKVVKKVSKQSFKNTFKSLKINQKNTKRANDTSKKLPTPK